jgi:hypothetical protein
MNPIAEFVLPVRAPSKKNSQVIVMIDKHPSLQPSKLYKMATNEALAVMRCRRSLVGMETVTGLLQMKCTFYVAHRSDSRNAPDLMNLLHAPADWLQEAGIIGDDRQIRSVDGSRVIFLCDDCPNRKSGCNYQFRTRLKKNGEPWVRKGKVVRDKINVCARPQILIELYAQQLEPECTPNSLPKSLIRQ